MDQDDSLPAVGDLWKVLGVPKVYLLEGCASVKKCAKPFGHAGNIPLGEKS